MLQGFVISDSEALDRLSHPYGSNYRNSVLLSVNAGIDMVEIKLLFPKNQARKFLLKCDVSVSITDNMCR